MVWSYEQIKNELAHYYPKASFWPAIIQESEMDADIDGNLECAPIEGYAVDLNGNGHVDRFLFNAPNGVNMAISAPDLDYFLRPLTSSKDQSYPKQSQVCQKNNRFSPTAFPYTASFFPDSSGKIKRVLFVASRMHSDAMTNLMRLRPDISYNIQTYYPEGAHVTPDNVESAYFQKYHRFLPRELALYAESQSALGELSGRMVFSDAPMIFRIPGPRLEVVTWPQDRLFAGINEFGESVFAVTGQNNVFLAPVRTPYLRTFEQSGVNFVEYKDVIEDDGGDVIGTKTHIFRNSRTEVNSDVNFWQTFGHGKKIISIDTSKIPSATHLDMILTPTDEVVDGKPLLFVAEEQTSWFESKSDEGKALDSLAKKLEDQGFLVERIPAVLFEAKIGNIVLAAWMFSYNNILMERYEENGKLIRRVYMPWHDDDRLKKANEQAKAQYEKFGYEVIPIHGLIVTAQQKGSLRCLVKVIERDHL